MSSEHQFGIPTTGFQRFYQTVCTYVSTRGHTQPSSNLVQIVVSAKAWTSLLITNPKIHTSICGGRKGRKIVFATIRNTFGKHFVDLLRYVKRVFDVHFKLFSRCLGNLVHKER